jgi:hypothetical protein
MTPLGRPRTTLALPFATVCVLSPAFAIVHQVEPAPDGTRGVARPLRGYHRRRLTTQRTARIANVGFGSACDLPEAHLGLAARQSTTDGDEECHMRGEKIYEYDLDVTGVTD